MLLTLTTIPHAKFARFHTRYYSRDELKYREGHDQRCRQGTTAREPRIRTTNDTVSVVACEQNAQSQPDTMHALITIFSTR